MALVLLEGGAGVRDADAVGRGPHAGDVAEGVLLGGQGTRELGREGPEEAGGPLPEGGDGARPCGAPRFHPEGLQVDGLMPEREGHEDRTGRLGDRPGRGHQGENVVEDFLQVGKALPGGGAATGPALIAVAQRVSVGPPERVVQVEALLLLPERALVLPRQLLWVRGSSNREFRGRNR